MSYSGAQAAKTSRENLGKALAALQEDPNIPQDVLNIAQNIAQAMAALFDAERAGGEPDGKAAVKRALGIIGQTLALLQDVRGQHRGIQLATETIAQSMSVLYPLTTQPSIRPPAPAAPVASAPMMGQPAAAMGTAPSPGFSGGQGTVQGTPFAAPAQAPLAPGVQQASAFASTQPQQPAPYTPPAAAPASPPAPQFGAPIGAPKNFPATVAPATQAPAFVPPTPAHGVAPQPAAGAYRGGNKDRVAAEVNIGANTDSNFYVGFSGEISEGGVFCATYNIQPRGTPMRVLVTLPGNFEKHVNGFVRFVRDPMDLTAESEPGMGIQFEGLDPEARELILRFIRKRPPMFYDE